MRPDVNTQFHICDFFFFCFFFCFLFFRGKLKISLKVCVNPVKAGASVGLVFSPQLLSENQTSRSAPLRSSPKRSRQTVYQLRRALTTRSKQHHQYLNRSIMIYSVTAEKRGDGFCQTVFSPLITTSLNNGLRPVWTCRPKVCRHPDSSSLLGSVHTLLATTKCSLLDPDWKCVSCPPKIELIHSLIRF